MSYLASVDPLRYQIDCLVPKLSCKIFTNDQGADEALQVVSEGLNTDGGLLVVSANVWITKLNEEFLTS